MWVGVLSRLAERKPQEGCVLSAPSNSDADRLSTPSIVRNSASPLLTIEPSGVCDDRVCSPCTALPAQAFAPSVLPLAKQAARHV